ncbi:hypothetical protein AADEFJLK_02619 [Methylovulum psychrotolerans]|uniref:Uncharacterized protein n=1 Tax=Methylovulum psychrotolerans TaxID=1704499 RepID=A0A2S5CLP4_9GAMM|nr:hypothetical protein AADEFJLK_02619 [Methylovulum psychrotolerans]
MPPLEPYSIATKIAFWFLWLICAAFLLLVVRMAPMLNIAFWSMPKGGAILWFSLVILGQGGILFKLTKQFLCRTLAASLLINRLALTTFALPFVAVGGCSLFMMSLS